MTLTHFDENGRAIMVDVSDKESTCRIATAEGTILLSEDSACAVREKSAKKGDVLAVAEIAGIMAMKKTYETIPLCHNIPLSCAKISFDWIDNTTLRAIAIAKTTAQTGVEMEALNGVSVALLTVYDMLKAINKNMTISNIRLLEKSGGKSGDYKASEV